MEVCGTSYQCSSGSQSKQQTAGKRTKSHNFSHLGRPSLGRTKAWTTEFTAHRKELMTIESPEEIVEIIAVKWCCHFGKFSRSYRRFCRTRRFKEEQNWTEQERQVSQAQIVQAMFCAIEGLACCTKMRKSEDLKSWRWRADMYGGDNKHFHHYDNNWLDTYSRAIGEAHSSHIYWNNNLSWLQRGEEMDRYEAYRKQKYGNTSVSPSAWQTSTSVGKHGRVQIDLRLFGNATCQSGAAANSYLSIRTPSKCQLHGASQQHCATQLQNTATHQLCRRRCWIMHLGGGILPPRAKAAIWWPGSPMESCWPDSKWKLCISWSLCLLNFSFVHWPLLSISFQDLQSENYLHRSTSTTSTYISPSYLSFHNVTSINHAIHSSQFVCG